MEFDETQVAIEQAVRQFCLKEVEPVVARLESGEQSPYELMRSMSKAFQLEDLVSGSRNDGGERPSGEREAKEGAMNDPVIAAIFAKELARVSPGLCLCVVANMGCGVTIAAKGDRDLVERCAIPVMSMQRVGCWALTEAGSGSDAFGMQTSARFDGDEVIVRGSKSFISNAPFADVFLIYARLEGGTSGDKRRIYPVVLERGMQGLSTGEPLQKLGMHASPTGEIFLDDVRAPRSNLLGDPDRPARDAAEATLASERIAIVAMCLGVIERCLDDSIAYSIDRVQFGKPIAAFQLIQQKLARMYTAQENVRNSMFALIQAQRTGRASERLVSAAKWYATESAAEVALEAVQLFGGAGYTREYAPERLFRDIKLWTIGGGTSEIQQLTIAKDLLRERGFSIDLAGGYRDERAPR